MATPLPALRRNLDFMPSPVPERPGLLIRDPYQYSDATLIVPAGLVECLQCFDGIRTELDLRSELFQLTGDLQVGELEKHLCNTLSDAGFLEDENYQKLKQTRHREFAKASKREPAHSGSAYPEYTAALRLQLVEYLDGEGAVTASHALKATVGIAAPHVSPGGGWESYRAAYSAMPVHDPERVYVILGTSHYGAPERFGLTRKPFVTPLGEARTEVGLVNWLEQQAGAAIEMEDYCHAVEHSIEFQVLFLQHLYGPDVRILPILCGAYAQSIYMGGKPEDNDKVNRFLGALGDLSTRQHLFWVLGVDMAHMGRRYGDPFVATSEQDIMTGVGERDRERIRRINEADAIGFWDLVQEKHDDLKWCGSSPFYTFLKAVPDARGDLLRYQQWNIDEQSVVSFAAMSFHKR